MPSFALQACRSRQIPDLVSAQRVWDFASTDKPEAQARVFNAFACASGLSVKPGSPELRHYPQFCRYWPSAGYSPIFDCKNSRAF